MKRVIIRRRVTRRKQPANPAQNVRLVDDKQMEGFNPSILGLGDINSPAKEVDAIAAVFDLARFTNFCNQPDPHLVVPKFLSNFLDWLFFEVKNRLVEGSEGERQKLWAELPFLAKFMGDGVLFLWNTQGLTETLICKIVTTLYDISRAYRREFYPQISHAVDKAPTTLRCGIARGKVFSVGNGRDYIGHCINTASRLQKLSLLTFCFPHRGFNIQQNMPDEYRNVFIQKLVSIRGVGENELVWVINSELERLPEKSRAIFRNPSTI